MNELRAIKVEDVRGARLAFDLRDLEATLGDRIQGAWWLVAELDASSWGNDPTFDAELNRVYEHRPPGLLLTGPIFLALVNRIFQTLDAHVRAYDHEPDAAELASVAMGAPDHLSSSWLVVRLIASTYTVILGRDDVVAAFESRYRVVTELDPTAL